MIEIPTVLVLGAGASKPYGLPLAWELTDFVRKREKLAEDGDLARLLDSCGSDYREAREFARALVGSGMHSVDAFIGMRGDLAKCGRLLMAYELCVREIPDSVIKCPHREENWYKHLWERMHAGVKTIASVRANNLRIVTLNYDRSFEYFLLRAIKDTYGLQMSEALEGLSAIPILHLYGSLGPLGLVSGETCRTYDSEIKSDALRLAAASIKVIPDARDDNDRDFQRARDWFAWGTHIGFMGFSFEEKNCERLGLADVLKAHGGKQVFASTYGMTPIEVTRARQRVCSPLAWETEDRTCLSFLRHSRLL